MKSFVESLNLEPKQLREERVKTFVENIESDAVVIRLDAKRQVNELNSKLSQLTDLGEDNTMSIASKLKNINTRNLMEEIYKTAVELRVAEQNLEVIDKAFNELFPKSKYAEGKE